MSFKDSLIVSAVEPDPPVGLNWTLLNVSLTGTHFDIMVTWRPPDSADVKMGWMTLSYEVQHRSLSSDHWEVVSVPLQFAAS